MRAVILVVLVALVFRAEARIGETEEQCVGRYGKVIRREHREKPPAEVCLFETGRFRIWTSFLKGHVAAMQITTLDDAPFSEDELQVIMKANSGRATWREIEGAPSRTREFRRSDDEATMFVVKGDALLIESTEWKAASEGTSKF